MRRRLICFDRAGVSILLIFATLWLEARAAQTSSDGAGPPIAAERQLPQPQQNRKRSVFDQSHQEAHFKSVGCIECHKTVGDPHQSANVVLGCTDCHGGNAAPNLKKLELAHVRPKNPKFWETSANPNDSSVLLNHESLEFIRFVNPGDLRVADQSCGKCHADSVHNVPLSMMNHGCMLWGAALYNNGAFPRKNYVFGQAYGPDGQPMTLTNPYPVTAEDTRKHGIIPEIRPLPRFALSQPGNILRIFELGGEKPLQLGLPTPTEPPGRPLRRLSERGLGTLNRIDPVFLNLQKTRLHDPLLGFMGSNNQPGDYRSSGCTACHVVYANDRSPSHSGWWSQFGHQGLSFDSDPMIPKNERGHPVYHKFTRSIPSSQCMPCHMHQGNLFVNPFLGYMWWDQESDGDKMYPHKQKDPTDAELVSHVKRNPEAAAARGNWSDLDFLEKVAEKNPKLEHNQFADYHGHGWIFRAVFKKDRKGNLLDLKDQIIPHGASNKWAQAVHLKDVHLAKGMQCVDCHFLADVHGTGQLYTEPRAATTIECIDCHGTITSRPTLITSGNGGKRQGPKVDDKYPHQQTNGVNLLEGSTPWGPRFEWQGNKLIQYSMMQRDMKWEIPQTKDTIDSSSPRYNPKSAYAKTIRRNNKDWGDLPKDPSKCPEDLAHDNSNISCQVCHSSWATSCFGCHLPMKANQRVPLNKFEGGVTRNFTSYNPQVLRDDVFMLGIDSTVKNNRLAVLRSSSAVLVGSQNQNREWIYSQQQTVSAEGYSGQAFNPHFPHTTSGVGTTKNCTDCHVSAAKDNNAIMTQLLGFGTGTVNFFGRYAWVGAGTDGFYGVVWTEQDEPQAAIGSYLHKLAYPQNFQKHVDADRQLHEHHHHHGKEILDLTLRGEYLYTANGPGGLEIFDVANIDQKGFSERIVTAPVSPIGQKTYIRTPYATSVALPSTLGIDPLRTRDPVNEEQPIHGLYGGIYVTDREEGLLIASAAPLVDGNPDNNFLSKPVKFNPDGKLKGATKSFVAGQLLYLTCDRGLMVIDLGKDGATPRLIGESADGALKRPKDIAIQFQYAFVTDEEGLKILDIANPSEPIVKAQVALTNCYRLYVARTYAYVACGPNGLAIVDIEKPEKPGLFRMYNAEGKLNDTRAVQIGSVNASMYALVADGRNGLRVIQLISPENVPTFMGFSPKPEPKLIATYQTKGPAVAVSRGLDRDRIVDETGNQTVVFGRRGSRPFKTNEMAKFVTHKANGQPYFTENIAEKDGKLIFQSGREVDKPKPFNFSDQPRPTQPPQPSQRVRQRAP